MKKIVRREALEAALKTGFVRPQEEEFQPEAFGMNDFIVLILQISVMGNAAELITYFAELIVQMRDFGLEGARTSLLSQR